MACESKMVLDSHFKNNAIDFDELEYDIMDGDIKIPNLFVCLTNIQKRKFENINSIFNIKKVENQLEQKLLRVPI